MKQAVRQRSKCFNTSPKSPDGAKVPMQYDVLLPGGQPVAGLIPWTAKYNLAIS